jgi:hypothetical protein
MAYTQKQKIERSKVLVPLIEKYETLILVEGIGDQAFLNGIISKRYPHLNKHRSDVKTVEFHFVEPSGSKEKVYSDAQLLAELIEDSETVVKQLILIRDGDETKNKSDYQKQYEALFSHLDVQCHIYLVKDFETNQFNDLERLIMSITKPDFEYAVTVKNRFVKCASRNGIQEFKKQSKRELNVWLASLPDFEGRTDRLLLNKIEKYLDLTHRNLDPLYAILDPYFESSPNAQN